MAKILVLVASWDSRFLAGARTTIEAGGLTAVHCISSLRYSSHTQGDRDQLDQICEGHGVEILHAKIDFDDQVETLSGISGWLELSGISAQDDVIFDISTCPRNVLWLMLSCLKAKISDCSIRYFPAMSYDSWFTNDEGDPRLIFNNSGVMYPDLPTCLVMMCGPEIGRAEKMFYRFEPRRAIIIRDIHAPDYGVVANISQPMGAAIQEVIIDNKDISDSNVQRVVDLIAPLSAEFNVVCSSFGPKLGAVILYKAAQKLDEMALSYLPSGIHNMVPSSGMQPPQDQRLTL